MKYADSPRVYRLEVDLAGQGTLIKRWVVDERIFETLNFRWDRIVVLDSRELYPDGTDIRLDFSSLSSLSLSLYHSVIRR